MFTARGAHVVRWIVGAKKLDSNGYVKSRLVRMRRGRLVLQVSELGTADWKHECFKKFCKYCNKNQPSGDFATWFH